MKAFYSRTPTCERQEVVFGLLMWFRIHQCFIFHFFGSLFIWNSVVKLDVHSLLPSPPLSKPWGVKTLALNSEGEQEGEREEGHTDGEIHEERHTYKDTQKEGVRQKKTDAQLERERRRWRNGEIYMENERPRRDRNGGRHAERETDSIQK